MFTNSIEIIQRTISRNHRFWLSVLIFLFLLLVLPARVAFAAPVAPDKVELIQPEGTVIVATPFGDEWSSGYEHRGYTIVLDLSSNFWVYAARGMDGRLAPGLAKAGIDTLPAGLQPHLRDTSVSSARPVENAPQEPLVWSGAEGSHKLIVILVDFTPSASLFTTDAQWNQLFFNTTAGAKSIKSYYQQASFGQFSLDPADETYGMPDDGVIAVTLPYAHPDPASTGDVNRTISRNAILAADPFINYSSFDTDSSGGLDVNELHLMVIVRGNEEAYGGSTGACAPHIWGHRWSLYGTVPAPQVDGVYVGALDYGGGYTQEGEWHEMTTENCPNKSIGGHMATMGIMAHELGHDIDWPDLYDTDGSSEGVGYWSIMGSGNWTRTSTDTYSGQTPVLPDAFLKWYQGWITPIQQTFPQSGVAIQSSADHPTAYLLGANPGGVDWDFDDSSGTGEYFLVENRQLVGFDAGLWRIDTAGNAKGCVIWHIDETRPYDNTANATETRKLVDVEEADGPPQDMDSTGNRGDDGDPWPGSANETAFTATSDPNSNWYSSAASGIALTNISTAGTGCTVDFSGIGLMWTGAVNTSWNNTGNWSINRLPGQNDNVSIPSSVPNWPNVNAAASAGNLSILDGAHLNATAAVPLDVYGNWNEMGSGYLDATAGTVVFRGSIAQTITAGAASHFNHLQIGNGSTMQIVTANSNLDVNGNLTIQPGANLSMGSYELRVGGDWTDNPTGFSPGTGTVVFDGTTQSIQRATSDRTVYANNFTNLAGWTVEDANADGNRWVATTSTSAPNSPNSGQHARYYSNNEIVNDWLFSPGFSLQAGVTYTIRFNYGASNAAKTEKLEVKIGASQDSTAMINPIFNDANVTNTTWQQGSGTFVPGSSGVYYVGFHLYSNANKGDPAVDDLVVTVPDPNPTLYNLSIANGSTATLGDPANLLNNLTINAGGMLVLGSYDLTLEGTVVNQGALAQTRTVNAASTAFLNLKNGAGSVDKYMGAVINPGSASMGSTTVTIWGNQLCPMASVGAKRCFDISPTIQQNATITFYYTEAERNGVNNADMSVFHWNGSLWNQESGATTRGGSGDSQWVQVTDVLSYSPFSLNDGSPTAVTMADFTGRDNGDGSVLLQWQTASELDILGFILYRAGSDDKAPVRINDELIMCQWPGSLEGGTYSLEDKIATTGRIYDYWIEMIRSDGGLERFGPVRVTVIPDLWFHLFYPLVIGGQ